MSKDILEKLKDLHEQATNERSHHYVASCCREAIAEIVARREDNAALSRENAKLRECSRKLACFARAYSSHPRRNPDDTLNATLAEHESL